MKLRSHKSSWVLNLLVATAISVVVNFSSVLLLFIDNTGDNFRHPKERIIHREEVGVLSVVPNGHGYLIYPNQDTAYVLMSRIRKWGLEQGDRIQGDLISIRRKGAYPTLYEIKTLNGKEFDYAEIFHQRPSATKELYVQLIFYFLFALLLLTILTHPSRHHTTWKYVRTMLWTLLLSVGLYFVAPTINWHAGKILPNFTQGRLIDYLVMMKCSFVTVVAILYGWIYLLISQRQSIVLENEQLKNENLSTRYNLLVGQINPHFFFNSLNSLAMLVREMQHEKALTYIDQLSYTFRYIIQNGQTPLITLNEEMKFEESYSYLFKIRYEDKLFFDVEIDKEYGEWQLPALSLQPLIGNAVKHNAITRTHPLHIKIYNRGNILIVENAKMPKLTPEPSTGIGLENLKNRWILLTGEEIEIVDTATSFEVRLPLQKPQKKS